MSSDVITSIVAIFLTLGIFMLALALFKRSKGLALLHPLITSVGAIVLGLFLLDIPYDVYVQQTQILHWMLGPATVALAVPLYSQLRRLREYGIKLILPILIGGAVGPLVAIGVLLLGPHDNSMLLTMLTKSITTPLAMETANVIGGHASLAAAFVIITGVIGASMCHLVFKRLNINSDMVKGIALGTSSHAVGAAEGFRISEKCGAFATLALCINGVATAIILPILYYMLK